MPLDASSSSSPSSPAPAPSSASPLDLARGPRPHDTFELRVTHLAPGGFGVASLEVALGPQRERRSYKVHVRKALPGDLVLARVEEVERRRLTARIDAILSPSDARLPDAHARCPHFGLREQPGRGCGGCTLQSASYDDQLALKLDMVRRLLDQAGLADLTLAQPVGMDDPWFYRNKMEFSFGDYLKAKTLTLGLHPSGYKHDVLDLTDCVLLSPQTPSILSAARAWARAHSLVAFEPRHNSGFLRTLTLREGKRTGQRMLTLTTSGDATARFDGHDLPALDVARSFAQAMLEHAAAHHIELTSITWTQHVATRGQPTSFRDTLLHGSPHLEEQLHLPLDKRLRFTIHPRAFFQPNTLQAEQLYAQVLRLAGLLQADDDPATSPSSTLRVLDLYCGTGTIGLCMAPYVGHVTGVELNPEAVLNAQANAALNDIHNVSWIAGDVGQVLASGDLELERLDLVVVDPPRAGLMPQAVEQLAAIAAPTLIYVSCNPESLARDLKLLMQRGYAVERLQPVDLFPHTHHIEHVARLTRRP